MRTIDADYLINVIDTACGNASLDECLGMAVNAMFDWATGLVNQCPTIPGNILNRENFKAILDTFLPYVKDEVKNDIINRVLLESHTSNYWIDHSNDDISVPKPWYAAYECPVCHHYSSGEKYCPWCGRRNIRKGEEDEYMDDQ